MFYAANTFLVRRDRRPPAPLAEEKKMNESAKCKIIGITLETRPDCITPEEIRYKLKINSVQDLSFSCVINVQNRRFRRYGCTRVQIGVQHTNDSILKKINRGCSNEDTKRALRLLKDSCYKIDIHLMPNLPGKLPSLKLSLGFANVITQK